MYGIFAYVQPCACCETCMWEHIDDYILHKKWNPLTTKNMIVYHYQNWETAKDTGELTVSYKIDDDKKRLVIARLIEHFGGCWQLNERAIKVYG